MDKDKEKMKWYVGMGIGFVSGSVIELATNSPIAQYEFASHGEKAIVSLMFGGLLGMIQKGVVGRDTYRSIRGGIYVASGVFLGMETIDYVIKSLENLF